MKFGRKEIIAVSVCAAIAVFAAGFFLGRSYAGREVVITTAVPGSERLPYARSGGPEYGGADRASGDDEADRVNVNTAGVGELMTLPGIGRTLAERIVRYREENGEFAETRDIMRVSGIGEQLYGNISDLITV